MPLPIQCIREHAETKLCELIKSLGKKVELVVDDTLSGPLNLITSTKVLKKNGICGMHHVNEEHLPEATNILFLVRPDLKLMELMAKQIHQHRSTSRIESTYCITFVPRSTIICKHVLVENGISLDSIIIKELNLDLIPFDTDVLSYEIGCSSYFVDGDITLLNHVKNSILGLENIFGTIPIIRGVGSGAQLVGKLLKREKAVPNIVPQIDTLILFDRSADWVTPLLFQCQFEGLIDEIYGIKNNLVTCDDGNRLIVDSSVDIMKELRDLTLSEVGTVCTKKFTLYKEKFNMEGVEEISEMNTKLKMVKPYVVDKAIVEKYFDLACSLRDKFESMMYKRVRRGEALALILGRKPGNEIRDLIDNMMAAHDPLMLVLRLLCMYSLVKGITKEELEYFKMGILQCYGFKLMLTLHNLEKVGLLRVRRSGVHVMSSVKMVEDMSEGGDKKNGDIFEIVRGDASNNGVVLVYFIGGVTRGEISALRKLGKERGCEYVVCTTRLISGTRLLEEFGKL